MIPTTPRTTTTTPPPKRRIPVSAILLPVRKPALRNQRSPPRPPAQTPNPRNPKSLIHPRPFQIRTPAFEIPPPLRARRSPPPDHKSKIRNQTLRSLPGGPPRKNSAAMPTSTVPMKAASSRTSSTPAKCRASPAFPGAAASPAAPASAPPPSPSSSRSWPSAPACSSCGPRRPDYRVRRKMIACPV